MCRFASALTISLICSSGIAACGEANPDMPESRYFYPWAIDDDSGVFDGADRDPLERWLTSYLEQQ